MTCNYHFPLKKLTFTFFLLLTFSSIGWSAEPEGLNVTINGIKDELLENVDVFLSISKVAKEHKTDLLDSFKTSEEEKIPDLSKTTIQRLHRLAPKEIRQAIQPFGYYNPSIEAQLKKIGATWQAVYTIDHGPPTIIDRLEIKVDGKGGMEPAVREVLNSTELLSGQRLDHRQYEQTKKQLSEALYRAGYIDARFIQTEIKIYPQEQKADIYLTANSGPQFCYGPILIEQDILHPELINRYVSIKEGDRFDSDKLMDLQLTLTDSNYFSEVEIQAARENAVGTSIPVIVKTKPKKPRRYTTGFGFGTDTGPRVSGGAEFRRINRRGHKIRFDLRASLIEQSISSQYLIPIKNVATDNLAFTASVSREQEGDIDTDQFKFGVSLNENWWGLRRRLYFNLERENFDIGAGTQTSTLLIPGVQLSSKRSDDSLFPRKGYSTTFDIHGGLESPVTETTFLHTSIGLKTVLPLTKRSRLLMRGELGIVEAADFPELPPSQRFFAGGDQSVRGYGYQDLSPKNSIGEVIGGQYLAVASIETDYLFYKNFGVATFFDVGNSSDELLPSLKKGIGVGLRYRSPVGMIRLDLARPLDDAEDSFRLHISIGADL